MLNAAINEAIKMVEDTFSSKYKMGKAVGGTFAGVIGGLAIKQFFTKRGGASLSKKQEIHADEKDGINTKGKGTLVSVIYQDDKGKFHKNTGDQWYEWNGTQWV